MRVLRAVRRGLRRIAAAALCVAPAAVLACGRAETVPAELLGIWKTKAERHADAFFEIRPSSLMLGIGRRPLEVLWFDDLEIEKDADGNDVLRFYYTGETEGETLVVTRLRGRREIRVGAGEGSWYPSRSR
jgi:hypothetical protein